MRLLDIVVTHYNEPWEVVAPFFKMLDLQRGIDFNDLRVILIHDGTEEFPSSYFDHCPYIVEQHVIPHGGISEARNAGIDLADAEWISFSDCDDMYFCMCSLYCVMQCLRKGEYHDMLSAEFISESGPIGGPREYGRAKVDDTTFIHGNYFRLSIIKKNNLRFDPGLPYNEDSLFNYLFLSYVAPGRFGSVNADFPIYVWVCHEGSLTRRSGGTWWKLLYSMYMRDKKIAFICKERKSEREYQEMCVRTIVDIYYLLQHEDVERQWMYDELLADMKEFYREHRKYLNNVSNKSLKEVTDIVHKIVCTDTFRTEYVKGPNEIYMKEKYPEFRQWLRCKDEEWLVGSGECYDSYNP